MLSFLIVLYALIGVQGKAFPNRYKRNYEGSYHYIPYEEGIVHITGGYSPENLPNYQDYVHGYVQTNGHDWSAYYQSMLPEPLQHPYSNINEHHKTKAKHTWHFTDQSRVPVTRYTDGMHQLKSGVEAPNVIEALVKKEVIDRHGEYDTPIVVDTLVRKGHMDRTDAEVPVVSDSLTIKEKPINSKYDGNTLVTEPSASKYMHEPIKDKPIKEKPIKDVAFISSNEFELPVVVDALSKKDKPIKVEPVASYGAFELPVVDSLTKKDKPVKVEPPDSYNMYVPIKEKPIKDAAFIYSNEFELPVVVGSLTKKDKPDKVEPVSSYGAFELPVVVDSLTKKDKPVKVEPVASYGAFALPIVDSLTKKDKPVKVEPVASYGAFELPIVDSLTKKDKPVKVEPVASYGAFELPIVDSLTKKDKPVKVEPVASYGAFELPIVDSLTKKDKPVKVEPAASYGAFELPIVDSLTKKDKPVKVEPVASYGAFELPIVDSLTKKDKPVKVEPVASYGAFELPIVDSLTKKDKPVKVEPVASYGAFELPIVDSLTKKDKPVKVEPAASYGAFELPIVDSLTKKDKPVKVEPAASYGAFELPIVDSLTKKDKPVKVEPAASYGAFELPIVDSLTKKDKPVKVEPVASYGAFELPIVDSLTKKDKPVKVEPPDSYNMYVPIKEKPIKDVAFIYSNGFELPVNVDSLTKKDKPDKVEPISSYGAFELPVAVDSLGKKDKPIKVKPADSYNMYEPVKEKPIKDAAFINSNEFELPVVVDSLTKKDKPIKVEPVASYGAFELPIVDSLTKKDKPIKVEPADSYSMYEPIEKPIKAKPIKEKPIKAKPIKKPIKEKPIKAKPIKKPIKEKPINAKPIKKPIKEKPIKEKPIKEKPIKAKPIKKPIKEKPIKAKPIDKPIKAKPIKEKPIKAKPIKKPIEEKPIKAKPIKDVPVLSYEALYHPLEFDSLNKVEEHEHETPVVIEALIRKERPTFHLEEEHESPIVVEALVRKHPPVYENKKTNTNEDKLRPKDLLHPVEESILTKEDIENFAIPVVEALTFDQDAESNESQKREDITFGETHSSDEPEMDSFDENGDHAIAMDFDGSGFARSFFPVESNIQEQVRRKFKNCITPKNETGNCMPFQLCPVSIAVINIDELLRNVCIIDEVFIGVCCPEFPVESVRVDWEQLKPDTEKLNEEKSSQISKECGKLSSRVTDQDPWPWMASLIAKSSDKILCGGALITEQYVLTAAHCTIRIPRNQILVRLGRPVSENRPEPDFEVIEIKRHAGYNPRTMQNDIALLKLSRRVQLGDFRRVVCLAKDEEGIEGLVSESASLLRWKETPGEIKDVESLAVISTRECQSRMRTAIADSILCTEPRTDEASCNADSGAPLIIEKDDKFEVIGILTWNRNDCDERFPAVFTRVSSYHRWIEKHAS